MATIVVFAAHNDDHALAMGGTIAKHFRQGDTVHTFIGSFGELSHPHLKPEIIRKTRVREAQRADRVYGGDGRVIFLGLREFKFEEDFERKGYTKKLARRLKGLRPSRIYIPAPNDLHKDHCAIAELVLDMTESLRCDVYAYYVYPSFRHAQAPRLYVDVSDTYRQKLEGLKAYKSQIKFFTYAITNNIVFVYALLANGLTGFLRGKRFVETFYKLR
jgi:N-acetylglucosamine malate deacetylase 1